MGAPSTRYVGTSDRVDGWASAAAADVRKAAAAMSAAKGDERRPQVLSSVCLLVMGHLLSMASGMSSTHERLAARENLQHTHCRRKRPHALCRCSATEAPSEGAEGPGRGAVPARSVDRKERRDPSRHREQRSRSGRAIDECRVETRIDAALSVAGNAGELHPIVRDEIYRIGYEVFGRKSSALPVPEPRGDGSRRDLWTSQPRLRTSLVE